MAAQPRNISKLLLVLGAILVFFGIGTSLFRRTNKIFGEDLLTEKTFPDDLLENCIEVPQKLFTCEPRNLNKYMLTECSIESLEKFPKSQVPDPLKIITGNTIQINTGLHIYVANHNYQLISWLFKKFPEKNITMRTVRDGNGCTPLLLALKVGAPSGILRTLISKDSALIAEKEGVTPLMLASRGVDPKITKRLLKTIGTDGIQHELERQDSKGRTVADWGKMDLNDMYNEFWKVTVDPSKSANSCFNYIRFSFPVGRDGKGTFENSDKVELRQAGFETGTVTDKDHHLYISLVATKQNVKNLFHIATDKGPTANRIREDLAKVFWPDEADQTIINKNWKRIRKDMGELKNQISSHRILHIYAWNQNENRRLINKFAIFASEQRRMRQERRPL